MKLIAGITAVASLSVASASVYAATGDEVGTEMQKGPRFDQETRDAIHDAMEAGDYEAWKNLLIQGEGEPKIFDFITEDNFAQFAEMHEARQNGDHETAKAIAEEIGFEPGMRGGKGQGKRGPKCSGDHAGEHPDHVEFERGRRGNGQQEDDEADDGDGTEA